jgi:HEAT repeat protein
LLVLGNAGSSQTLPVITRYLNDPAPKVRAAAVWALRRVDGPEADGRIALALARDPDAYVRRGAAAALGERPATSESLAAQKVALARDDSPTVRLAIVRNLAHARQSHPEVGILIEQTATDDSSDEVRELARQALRLGPGR